MPQSELQELVSVLRPHPYGEEGVRMSLDEVAKAAARGMTNAYVIAYARNKLAEVDARGGRVGNPRDRAGVLLEVMQQEKLWVPDSINAEVMFDAHLMACDSKNPHVTPDGKKLMCVNAGDCDCKTIALVAMFGAVGLNTMVVGHGYEGSRIEHVLGAVHVDRKWHYADPSVRDLKLGQCVPFQRERLLSVPNVKVLCDAASCLATGTFNPDDLEFVERGMFVGVSGLEGLHSKVVWDVAPPESVEWLGRVRDVEWIGQATQSPNNIKEIKQELSTTEKILLAGVVISAVSLGVHVYTLGRQSRRMEIQ